MSIQKETQRSLPSFELALRQGLEEFRANFQLSLHAARLALSLFPAEGFEADERLAAAGDDDLLAFAGLLNKAREVSFCVVNLDRGHIS